MTQRKSERLVNLLIALLSTRRFLSKQELRHIIEGYRDSTWGAFERQFERDKDELRSLGIDVETGSNDAFFDDEEGYRITRAGFELPEISFTAAELSALALAGQAWQDSLAADNTAQAFEALSAGGASPDPTQVPSIRPNIAVSEPDFDTVYDAVVRRVEVRFGYGESQRRLQPWRMLQRRGRWYVFGLDLDRGADRFFKLARFTAPARLHGRSGVFSVPAEASTLATRLEPDAQAKAIVAIREGVAHTFGEVTPARWEDELPPGFTAYTVALVSDEAIVAEIAAAGPDAIALSPEPIRQAVIAHLMAVAS